MTNKSSSGSNRPSLPVLFTLAILIAYGVPVFLGWFSFYGDDWIYIYEYHLNGTAGFPAFVAWDRPYSAWIYILATSLFGEHVFPYHLLLLLQRWLAVFLFFKILQMVWSDIPRVVSGAVLLFAVYPGFHQQPIAVQYILHFASLDLCLFSIWCMLKAFDSGFLEKQSWKGILLTIAGFFSSLTALFSCEYFIGLELVRPFLLWFRQVNRFKDEPVKKPVKIGNIFFHWFPYLLSMMIFIVWRVFIFSFQTYQPKLLNKFNENPASALSEILRKILTDLYTVTIAAWKKSLNQPAGKENQVIFWLLILVCFFLFAYSLRRFHNREGNKQPAAIENEKIQFLITGLVALLAAGIPYWVTMINIELDFPWDRPTISFSIGVAMLISVGISFIFQNKFQTLVTASLIAFAIGSHYTNALVYRNEAEKMNDYFWQLAWRAPQLQPGTILVSEQIPLDRYSDNDLTPVVNWQYAPALKGNTYQYKYFDLDLRSETYFRDLRPGQPIVHDYRSHHFESDSSHVLALFYKKGSCLWTITESEAEYPGLPENIVHVAGISDINLIRSDSAVQAVPPSPIGKEPDHGYCYYFQEINRAFQNHDRETAYQAADTALKMGLSSQDPLDFIPAVKALILGEDWSRAAELSKKVIMNPENLPFLCEQISGIPETVNQPEYTEMLKTIGCVTQ